MPEERTTSLLRESLYPIITRLIDLGKSTLRWRNVWTDKIDVATTATVPAPIAASDAATKKYVDDTVLANEMVVEEVDGAPSYTGIETIRFDQADGFVVSQPAAGIARIDITAIPTANLAGPITQAKGGTNIDTSASTGIPKVSAGTWTVPTRVGTADGGTNVDTSGSTGVPKVSAGTWTVPTLVAVADGGSGNANLGAANLDFNFTFNGDFEIWGGGTSAVPTKWTAGGTPTVTKDTANLKISLASAKSVNASGAAAEIYQDIDLISGFGPAAWWGGKTVTAGAWVRSDTANAGRVQLDDGATTASSSYTPATNTWTFVTVTLTFQATPTRVRIHMRTEVNSTTNWDGAIVVVGSSLTDFIPSGWRGRKSLLVYTGPTIAQALTYYAGGATGWQVGDVNLALIPMPFTNWIARRLFAKGSSPPGAGQTYIYTFLKNGVASALTATDANAGTASDTTNEIAGTAGDTSQMRLVTSALAAASDISASVEIEETP